MSRDGERWSEGPRDLFKGYEIGKRMEVVGEEGTAIDDMIDLFES